MGSLHERPSGRLELKSLFDLMRPDDEYAPRHRPRSVDCLPAFSSSLLDLQERLRLRPLALLVLELHGLVDEDLAVVREHDPRALERPRGGALEVHPR